MKKVKFDSEVVILILAQMGFYMAWIIGIYDWQAHKLISFFNVSTMSLSLIIMSNLWRSQIGTLRGQVTDLKKRIEALEGSKTK
jgi:hypothetical protein